MALGDFHHGSDVRLSKFLANKLRILYIVLIETKLIVTEAALYLHRGWISIYKLMGSKFPQNKIHVLIRTELLLHHKL